MQIIIDRFEEENAVLVLENKENVIVPRVLVEVFSEGDVLSLEKDIEQTQKRKKRADEALRTLFQ